MWFADLRDLDGVGDPRGDLLDLLSVGEHERRRALALPADRDRFTVGVAMIRWCAGMHLGRAPGRVRVERRCSCGRPHGKPAIPGTGLHLSLSHSEDAVVLAATTRAPIGVDVERMEARDTTGLASVALHASERCLSPRDFYRYWCRKEAVLKATGAGLRVPPAEVVVSSPRESARLRGYRGRGEDWALVDLASPEGYAAALCMLAPGPVEVVSDTAGGLRAALAGSS